MRSSTAGGIVHVGVRDERTRTPRQHAVRALALGSADASPEGLSEHAAQERQVQLGDLANAEAGEVFATERLC